MSWALHPLTEEQTEVQKLAREFARSEIVPHSAEWDEKAYFEPTLVYSALKGVLQKQFVNRLDGVTVVSPSVLRALSRYFELDARVIPNGVDTSVFRPDSEKFASPRPSIGRGKSKRMGSPPAAARSTCGPPG